ncbi:SMP-30/gluconolactonase/LRE family protein [uncultured Litoreibacter sp.]|uniref:SMP-30/gluconolactonase/LRE family protein n=1 Tax=uncultured Litoreibacter sp. TaxID=1392394 RepID=UPI002625FCA6|nr:SMP-30/gluconolactonase/LRE family protein [uncultured Litoreibacter sp.]
MIVEPREISMADIIDVDVKLDFVVGGFEFIEGPVWHPQNKQLIFSDIPANKMYSLSRGDEIDSFRVPSNMANGNTFDADGRLLSCEHATSRVTRAEADGSTTVLAAEYDGKAFNSPNDIVVRKDGAIFFTDPTYGRMKYFGVERELEMGCQGVYCVAADGQTITQIADDFAQPNGLCFSLDQRLLYVNDTERKHIRRFNITADGTITGGEVWVSVTEGEGEGHPDGMKIDSLGNVYCTGPGGVHVIAPDGVTLGVIRMSEFTANFAWGGKDLCDLYFTSSTTLYRTRVKVPGLALF